LQETKQVYLKNLPSLRQDAVTEGTKQNNFILETR